MSSESSSAMSHRVTVLRRRWRIVAVTTVLCIGGALAFALLPPAQYLSEASVLVTPTEVENSLAEGGPIIEQEEIATQQQVLQSVPVAERVAVALGLDESPETLLESLSVAPIADTRVLRISVTRDEPEEAADIANAFAAAFVEYRLEQESLNEEAVTEVRQEAADIGRQLRTVKAKLAAALPATPADLVARRTDLRLEYDIKRTALRERGSTVPVAGGGEILLAGEEPEASTAPPLPATLALGLLLGLLLGISLAFLRERFDDTLRDESRLDDLVDGRPVLGRIPHWRRRGSTGLAAVTDPYSTVGESYRALAANVRFLLASAPEVDGPVRGHSLLVTSARDGEGKTSTAANLAVAVARSGMTVVLVDADLRNPQVAAFFDVAPGPGLSDVLIGDASPTYGGVEVGIEGLHVLPAGHLPPDGSVLAGAGGISMLLDSLSARFDLVIIDSAPLLGVADSLELASVADATLLVTRVRASSQRAISRAVDSVADAGGLVSGVVLNDSGRTGDRGGREGRGGQRHVALPRPPVAEEGNHAHRSHSARTSS